MVLFIRFIIFDFDLILFWWLVLGIIWVDFMWNRFFCLDFCCRVGIDVNEVLWLLCVWVVLVWLKIDEVGVEIGEGEDNGGFGSGWLEYFLGLFEELLGFNRLVVVWLLVFGLDSFWEYFWVVLVDWVFFMVLGVGYGVVVYWGLMVRVLLCGYCGCYVVLMLCGLGVMCCGEVFGGYGIVIKLRYGVRVVGCWLGIIWKWGVVGGKERKKLNWKKWSWIVI